MASADEHNILSRTFIAGADLSSDRYRAVKADSTANQVVGTGSAGERAMGILQNDPASGAPASVMMLGVSKVEVGAAVSFGDPLQTDTDGQLITALTGDFVVAIALDDAGGAAEIIPALVVAAGVPFDA